jgi:ATP-dependent phosphoenolpyruvate carboxykinase
MPEDMELGDDGGEEYVTDFKLHGYGECSKTTREVDAPLTRNIIGDDEHGNGNAHQRRE